MSRKKPYSYHTFLFPFLWKTENELFKTIDAFSEKLYTGEGPHWELITVPGEQSAPKHVDRIEYYGDLQYFKRDATKILLYTDADREGELRKKKTDEAVVQHYKLVFPGHESKFSRNIQEDITTPYGKYIIHKGDEQKEEGVLKSYSRYRYELDINNIKLSVYNTGIAILRLELEYWGDKIYYTIKDGETKDIARAFWDNCSIDDVNAINEYGRRTVLPYINVKKKEDSCIPDNPHPLIADKIKIQIGEFDSEEDFEQKNAECIGGTALPTHSIMQPLLELLSLKRESGCEFTGDMARRAAASVREDLVFLEPIMDDRMYVCCVVLDNYLSDRLSQKDADGEYTVFSDAEIYKLGFIETSCSCQSSRMRSEILHRCIYDRWIDWGTMDIITHHSFVRLTGESAPDHIYNSFLTQYVKMAELALAQRATLISLENDCVLCSSSDANKILDLQKAYVHARKNLLIEECTTQEQGIEEFRMLREELFVNEQAESLDKRLKDLYELETLKHNDMQTDYANKLAVAAFLFAVLEVFIKEDCNIWLKVICCTVFFAIVFFYKKLLAFIQKIIKKNT